MNAAARWCQERSTRLCESRTADGPEMARIRTEVTGFSVAPVYHSYATWRRQFTRTTKRAHSVLELARARACARPHSQNAHAPACDGVRAAHQIWDIRGQSIGSNLSSSCTCVFRCTWRLGAAESVLISSDSSDLMTGAAGAVASTPSSHRRRPDRGSPLTPGPVGQATRTSQNVAC